MATPKEQRDARPHARNIGTTDRRERWTPQVDGGTGHDADGLRADAARAPLPSLLSEPDHGEGRPLGAS